MRARRQMRLRTTTERETRDPADPYGSPVWKPVLEDWPCWRWSSSSRRLASNDVGIPITDLRVVMPLGSDVKGGDRLGDVVTKRGKLVQPGPVRIDVVLTRSDHLELSLTEARDGR